MAKIKMLNKGDWGNLLQSETKRQKMENGRDKDFIIFKDFIYSWETQREAETGRGRSRLHAGSPMWNSIWVSRITPWAEGGAKLLSHPGCPELCFWGQAMFYNHPLNLFPASELAQRGAPAWLGWLVLTLDFGLGHDRGLWDRASYQAPC